jgi:hypothetical protein
MKIHSTAHVPEGPKNPRIFFTSALTGCSIFVKGPADAPTVYHGGFDSNRDFTATPKLDPNSMQHWRILFDRYSPNTPNRGEANKGQYLADLTDSPDLQVYIQFLKNTAQGNVLIRSLIGEGNVFGIREANGNWTFYLQEVVTVQYQTFRIKKKLIGKNQRIESAVQNYRRPMCLREIYPNGNGQARVWNLEPVRI